MMSHDQSTQCFICGLNFKSSGGLNYHLYRKHGIGTHTPGDKKSPSEICDICGKLFCTKLSLRNHLHKKHGIVMESLLLPTVCHLCGKFFKTVSAFKSHFQTHVGKEGQVILNPVPRVRCVLCPRGSDRKVKSGCTVCGMKVCKDHTVKTVTCHECRVGIDIKPVTDLSPSKRFRCQLCPRNRDRKVRDFCVTCRRKVCKEHSDFTRVCFKCCPMPQIKLTENGDGGFSIQNLSDIENMLKPSVSEVHNSQIDPITGDLIGPNTELGLAMFDQNQVSGDQPGVNAVTSNEGTPSSRSGVSEVQYRINKRGKRVKIRPSLGPKTSCQFCPPGESKKTRMGCMECGARICQNHWVKMATCHECQAGIVREKVCFLPSTKRRCAMCPWDTKLKVKDCCMTCGRKVCHEHSAFNGATCPNCCPVEFKPGVFKELVQADTTCQFCPADKNQVPRMACKDCGAKICRNHLVKMLTCQQCQAGIVGERVSFARSTKMKCFMCPVTYTKEGKLKRFTNSCMTCGHKVCPDHSAFKGATCPNCCPPDLRPEVPPEGVRKPRAKSLKDITPNDKAPKDPAAALDLREATAETSESSNAPAKAIPSQTHPFPCQYCSCVFENKHQWWAHQITHASPYNYSMFQPSLHSGQGNMFPNTNRSAADGASQKQSENLGSEASLVPANLTQRHFGPFTSSLGNQDGNYLFPNLSQRERQENSVPAHSSGDSHRESDNPMNVTNQPSRIGENIFPGTSHGGLTGFSLYPYGYTQNFQ